MIAISDESKAKLIHILGRVKRRMVANEEHRIRLAGGLFNVNDLDSLIAELESAGTLPSHYIAVCEWTWSETRAEWNTACGRKVKRERGAPTPSLCQCNLPVLLDYRTGKTEATA